MRTRKEHTLHPSRIVRATAIFGVGLLMVAIAAAGFVTHANTASGASTTTATSTNGLSPQAIVGPVIHTAKSDAPPTSAECLAAYGVACYGPSDMQNEYDVTRLYNTGDEGQGQTIVIFDAFGSPTIQSDLATFDSAYNLPDPPSFKVYEPEGNVVLNYDNLPSPANYHSKNISTEVGWAYETTLDVEWSHAIAPKANIALVVSPVAETEGVQGLQNLVNAQQWVLSHHTGMIWSNSYAATEQSFNGTSSLLNLEKWYNQAAAAGVSNFFASGDSGVANGDRKGRLYPYPTVNFPTSSPSVISVGGTQIGTAGCTDVPPATITSYAPEAVWNDCYGAGGGGFSAIFSEPGYQSSAAIGDASGMRGVPDASYNAAVVSAINIYESFDPVYGAGWTPIGGTSAATPQWAAIDALANQADGSLGFLTPRLYQIYASPAYASAFHDITSGDNSDAGIAGYSAASGWDAASGAGTPDVYNLVTALTATS